MVETKSFEITNKLGMHARPAAKLASVAGQYKSDIFFERDGEQVDGKSVLSILTLACPQGSRVTIGAEGSDASEAIAALGKIIEERFGED